MRRERKQIPSSRVDPRAGRISVGELAARYMETIGHLAEKTRRSKVTVTKRIQSDWPGGAAMLVRDVRESHVRSWLSAQAKRMGKAGFRDECLNREQLSTLSEARVVIEDFRHRYNQFRPHSKLGYQSSADFAQQLTPSPAPVGLRPPCAGDGQTQNHKLKQKTKHSD